MRVFISWSGERSRLVAEALRYWLPKVIQAVQPWMSSSDVEKGTRWRSNIASELEQTSIGIICLTHENLASSWLHFEAGALSKQQQNTYVCTFLYGLEPADVREPLAQFQNTKAQREDVRKLVQTINNTLGDRKLPDIEVNESFDVWWPKLEERLKKIPALEEKQETQRPDRDILEEILGLIREQVRASIDEAVEYSAAKDSVTERAGIDGKGLSNYEVQLLANHFKLTPRQIRQSVFGEKISDVLDSLKAAEARRNVLRRHRVETAPLLSEDEDIKDEDTNP